LLFCTTKLKYISENLPTPFNYADIKLKMIIFRIKMSSPPEDCRVWTPCLYSEEGNKENKYILILLNQPVLDTEHLIR